MTNEQSQDTENMTVDGGGNANKADYPWLADYPEGVVWDQTIEPRTVFAPLDDAIQSYPTNVCTNFLGAQLTYREIGERINHVASGLQKQGIGKGQKVGLFLPNSPTFIIYYFAVLKIGGVVVNYNPLYAVEELEFQVRDSETDILVTLDLKVLCDKVEALLDRGILKRAIVCSFPDLLPGLKKVLFRLLKRGELSHLSNATHPDKVIAEADLIANDGRFTPADVDPHRDLAVLQYTGGTTGTPKGAMLSHANLSINVQQICMWATDMVEGQEKVMGILPFFHVFAMTTVMNYGTTMAAELILMPRFDLDDAMKLISRVKPTIMPGVPTLYNAMMNHPKMASSDFSSLKFCISGGAALPLEVKNGFEKVSGCSLVEGYGLSETSPVATVNPIEGAVKENSIGIPVPGTIVSIRSLEDPTQEMPLGENGEICISGPQVMSGYWNKPEETKNSFVGEFFRTGDVGHMDAQGFTFIVDRIKDLIISSGFNIYPRRIEEAIYEFPAVEEVTVLGIADERRGEAPKAFIKLKPGQQATSEEIMEFLEPKLSKLELPAEIEFRAELPKTIIGKLSKKELRAEAE